LSFRRAVITLSSSVCVAFGSVSASRIRETEFIDMTTALLRMAGAAAFITLSVFGIVAQTPEEVIFKDQIVSS
jgi:hypothetical protein